MDCLTNNIPTSRFNTKPAYIEVKRLRQCLTDKEIHEIRRFIGVVIRNWFPFTTSLFPYDHPEVGEKLTKYIDAIMLCVCKPDSTVEDLIKVVIENCRKIFKITIMGESPRIHSHMLHSIFMAYFKDGKGQEAIDHYLATVKQNHYEDIMEFCSPIIKNARLRALQIENSSFSTEEFMRKYVLSKEDDMEDYETSKMESHGKSIYYVEKRRGDHIPSLWYPTSGCNSISTTSCSSPSSTSSLDDCDKLNSTASISETDNKTTEGETTDSETTESETTDSETTDSEPTDNEITDGETTDGEITDSETTDGETTDGETTDSETTYYETTDCETTDCETTDDEIIESDDERF